MTARSSLEALAPNQAAAILDFAKAHGRYWKAALNHAWTTGRDERMPNGALLRQVRNNQGPTWLARLSLKGASTNQVKP